MITKIRNRYSKIVNKLLNKQIGIIYMLHRVDDFETDKLFPNENMKISPEFLENFISEKKEKFDFISLDEMILVIKGKTTKPKKPFIVFTIDDGYKDNYLKAFPIFLKYKIPFTIYITTNFPDSKGLLWWYIIEDIILKHDIVTLSTGKSFDCRTNEDKVKAFMEIRSEILELPYHNFEMSFYNLLSNYKVDNTKYDESLMTWKEISEMSSSPLCTIGAHSVSHFRMSKLEQEEIIFEIAESKKNIENQIGKQVNHFAYPFGTNHEINPAVIEMTKKIGFHSAVIAGGGGIRKHGTNPFLLQRIMLTELK